KQAETGTTKTDTSQRTNQLNCAKKNRIPRRIANAKTSTMPAMGIRGSRGNSGPGGWPVLAESPRENISRLQRRPDAREALDRPSAICLAERMDAVPRLLEEGRQRPR